MTRLSYQLSLALALIVLTLELSFVLSPAFNLYCFGLAVVFLVWQKKWRSVLACVLVPFLPALASYWSIRLRGQTPELAVIMLGRTFALAGLGLVFALGIDLEELLLTLEQKGLPSQFVYGLLVVIHALPDLQTEVRQIREASLLRGQVLRFWSPFYYVKVIFIACQLQVSYTQALLAHGYQDGAVRSCQVIYRQDRRVQVLLVLLIGLGQFCL